MANARRDVTMPGVPLDSSEDAGQTLGVVLDEFVPGLEAVLTRSWLRDSKTPTDLAGQQFRDFGVPRDRPPGGPCRSTRRAEGPTSGRSVPSRRDPSNGPTGLS